MSVGFNPRAFYQEGTTTHGSIEITEATWFQSTRLLPRRHDRKPKLPWPSNSWFQSTRLLPRRHDPLDFSGPNRSILVSIHAPSTKKARLKPRYARWFLRRLVSIHAPSTKKARPMPWVDGLDMVNQFQSTRLLPRRHDLTRHGLQHDADAVSIHAPSTKKARHGSPSKCNPSTHRFNPRAFTRKARHPYRCGADTLGWRFNPRAFTRKARSSDRLSRVESESWFQSTRLHKEGTTNSPSSNARPTSLFQSTRLHKEGTTSTMSCTPMRSASRFNPRAFTRKARPDIMTGPIGRDAVSIHAPSQGRHDQPGYRRR